ncbi:Trp biosynthesis-associated membrane protein [Diaminobutyricimonas sp. LJ205]|uniref:Trp biosynthesis-associated membrane protein n=1 Tax=Diaminobutyricimonas sp. LJ205 TaxID=2683590 RepID=UPI0012F4E7A2|nr:Trp biosynthesis-associated membrane protein [Diaminobutyricimonas sp. LJ205]
MSAPSGRRLKSLAILAGLVISAVLLLTWTQVWVMIQLTDGSQLEAAGEVASPAIAALGLAGLAAAAALSLAGPVFRRILGVLQIAVSGTALIATIATVSDPITASAAVVTDATGVSGAESVASLVSAATLTAWPFVALVAAVLGALLGVFIIVTASRWPGSGRKYQSVRLQNADENSAVDDWDALSDGQDPTDR